MNIGVSTAILAIAPAWLTLITGVARNRLKEISDKLENMNQRMEKIEEGFVLVRERIARLEASREGMQRR